MLDSMCDHKQEVIQDPSLVSDRWSTSGIPFQMFERPPHTDTVREIVAVPVALLEIVAVMEIVAVLDDDIWVVLHTVGLALEIVGLAWCQPSFAIRFLVRCD